MAIVGRKRVVKISIAAATFSSNVTNFPLPITHNALTVPSEFWSGDNHVDPTGEDVAFSTDLAGVTEIPAEKQYFDYTLNRFIFIVKIPTGNSAAVTEIYMHYGKALQTFPIRTATYGMQNVYRSEYAFFSHQNAPAGSAIDSTSYNVTGTYVGANFPEAINPGAFYISNEFDSADNNRISWAHGVQQWCSGAFSCGGIAYFAGFGTEHAIISKRADAAPFDGWELRSAVGGATTKIKFTIDFGANLIEVETTSAVISTATYYWIDVTFDGTNASGVKILLNGVSQTLTILTNTTSTYPTNTNALALGARHGGTTTNEHNGRLEDCYIYQGQLADAWCLARYRLQTAQATYVTFGTPADNPNYLTRSRITKCRTHGTYIDGAITDKDLLIDEKQITQVMWDNAKSNGGDILAYTSQSKTTRIPLEVATWDATNKFAQLYIPIATLADLGGDEVWLAYQAVEDVEQPFRDTSNGIEGVFDNGHVLVMHLEQQGNGTANEYIDSSPSRNHGQGSVSPTRVTGAIQKGQQGNGTTQRIIIGDSGFPTVAAVGTMEAVAFLTGDTSEQTPWGYGTDSDGQRRVIQQRDDGIGIHFSNTFRGQVARMTGRTTIAAVIPTGAVTSADALVYLNGAEITCVNLGATTPKAINTVKSARQVLRGTAGAYATDVMDECRHSNVVRSAAWLKVNHYNWLDTLNIWNPTFAGIQQLEVVGGGALKASFTEVTADYYNVYARPDNASVFSSAYLIGKFPAASVLGKVFFRAISDGKTLLNSMHNYYVGIRAEYQGTEEQNEVVLYVRPIGGEPVFVNDRHVGIIP